MSFTNELNYSSGYNTQSAFKEIQATLNPPLNIQQTSASTARFVIPAGVYNWSKAHIDLDILITSVGVVGSLDGLHMGKNMLIESLNLLYDGATQALVNLTAARVVSAATTLPQLSLDELTGRPIAHQNITNNKAILERCELIQNIKHSSLVQYAANGAANVLSGNTHADLSGMGGYAVEINQVANGATLVPIPVPGQDAVCTAIGKLPAAATSHVKIRINLSDYKNTLFAMDKTIYYPINATLIVNFAPWQQWGFSVLAASVSPSLDGSVFLGSIGASPSVVTLPSQPVLWIPYEANDMIAAQCRLITAENLRMKVPYVSVLPSSWVGSGTYGAPSSSGPYRYNCPLTQTYGNHILRIYTVVCRTDAGVSYLNNSNCVNANGAAPAVMLNNLYSSIRTFIGQRELQQGTLDCLNGEDYRYLNAMLKGSAISSQTQFQNASFFVDNFTNAGPSHMWDVQNSNEGSYSMIDANGFPKNDVYSVEINSNFGNAQLYFIIVGQKTMYVSNGVVTLDA